MGSKRDWREIDRIIERACESQSQERCVEFDDVPVIALEITQMDTAAIGKEITALTKRWLTKANRAKNVPASRIQAQQQGIERLKMLRTEFKRRLETEL